MMNRGNANLLGVVKMEQQTEATAVQSPCEPVQEQQTSRTGRSVIPLKRLKFETGLIVLFVAMAAMGAMVIMDVFFSMRTDVEGTLISNAFEAFKLIAVTVLGYIFGATHTGGTDGGG